MSSTLVFGMWIYCEIRSVFEYFLWNFAVLYKVFSPFFGNRHLNPPQNTYLKIEKKYQKEFKEANFFLSIRTFMKFPVYEKGNQILPFSVVNEFPNAFFRYSSLSYEIKDRTNEKRWHFLITRTQFKEDIRNIHIF